MELTILMPCLNEANTVETCIRKAQEFLSTRDIDGEILIADNGSTDGSQQIAERSGARLVQVHERGYGAALSAGVMEARGKYIVMGDSDDSYDFSRLDEFVSKLRDGFEFVMGNRFKGGIAQGAMPPLHRYLGNPVLSGIGRLFFGGPIGDFHCGLRAFERQAVLDLNLQSSGMEFASEMVVKATLKNLKMCEVPTTLRPDGRGRPPHLNSWRDGWRHLRLLFLLSPKWLFLYPGLFLAITGLMATALLALGPFKLGNIGPVLSIHSMLYASAISILGVQLILLAVSIRWMGVLSGFGRVPEWIQSIKKFMTFEKGLISGASFMAIGFLITSDILLEWSRQGYSTLEPETVMRLAIPSVTFIVVGMQISVFAIFSAAVDYWWHAKQKI